MEHFEPAEALALLVEERCTVAFGAVDRIWASILDQLAFANADISPLWLVAVRGWSLFEGYHKDSAPLDADGYLLSSDLGSLDASGRLFLGDVS